MIFLTHYRAARLTGFAPLRAAYRAALVALSHGLVALLHGERRR